MNNNHGRRRTRRVRQQRKQQKTQIGRILLTVGLMALIAVVSIGGTIAWLTDASVEIENTFTESDIDIDLTETTTDYKMVPGATIAKDPKITVNKGSEASWVFVEIKKNATYDTYLNDYEVRQGWNRLVTPEGEDKTHKATEVYYKDYAALTAQEAETVTEYILKQGTDTYANGYVTVKDSVTKSMMKDLTDGKVERPTLTFMAYAIQKDYTGEPADAWAKLQAQDYPPADDEGTTTP